MARGPRWLSVVPCALTLLALAAPASALGAPSIRTAEAENSGLSGSSEAFLHSRVTPNCDSPYIVYTAEWGTSEAFGNSETSELGRVTGYEYDHYVRAGGLSPGTLYYYRGKATVTCREGGTGGTVVGATRCFVAGQVQGDGSYNVTCPGATDPGTGDSGGGDGSTGGSTGGDGSSGDSGSGDSGSEEKSFWDRKRIKVKGRKCPSPPNQLVWPYAVRTKGVKCRVIDRLFADRRNHRGLYSRRKMALRPGYRCRARSSQPGSLGATALWKCKRGKRYFHFTNSASGDWVQKVRRRPFHPTLGN